MKKQGLILLSSLALFATGCASISLEALPKNSNVFIETDSLLKVTSNYEDKNGNTGTLIYGYDDGASISFGASYNGVFKASMMPIENNFGSQDLKEFSILFSDKNSDQQFSIKVFNYLNYSYTAICYNGELGGVNYFESQWSVGRHYGFSGIANNEGRYTKIENDRAMEFSFDPISLKVQTKLSDGNFHDVWDFSKDNNDGRVINNSLTPFNEYDISIVFDKVSSNGCADLLVYSFCGYDLSKDTINTSSPIINTHLTSNAVVNKRYEIPTPTASSVEDGELDSKNISITVYDEDGNGVSTSNNGFIPTKTGKYYLYYRYSSPKAQGYTYAAIEALLEENINIDFSDVDFSLYEGIGKTITIPSMTLTTNLGKDSSTYDCYVTVYKDDVVLDNYVKAKTGKPFTFSGAGTYRFVYGSDVTTQQVTKTVSVDGRMAINEKDDVTFGVGESFEVPQIDFFKQGKKVTYTSKVYSPTGEEIETVPFTVEEEGLYKVEYYLASEIKPFVKEYVAKKLTASLFDDNDASFGAMTTNNSYKGVKLSLQNNETITYNKVIDLRDFGFDPSLDDLTLNKEVLKLYFQPKTQGLADLEALYVQMTDVNNPSNYITIRLRYIPYFETGCFIRARASGQTTYVGYNYHFYSTQLDVHNASSHEEGGFQSYANFTALTPEENFGDMGFPLYFDNTLGRLYSRPSWLTGHNNLPTDNYDDIKVPWLIYDFKTDNATLSGANTPWKGFSTGEVYLSFYGKGISSSADIYITSINGETLDQKYITDTGKPTISIDKSEFVSDVAPTGLINKPYKVFDYVANDKESRIGSTSVEVYDMDNNKLSVTNDTFTPTKEGQYRIIYKASDVFGNEAKEETIVNITSSVPELNLVLNEELPTSIMYGSNLALPAATYGGGSGKTKLSVTAKTSDGKDVPIKNMILTANVPSNTYVVTYKVNDYLGNEKSINKTINVQVSEEAIFDENSVILPTAFVNNDDFTFGHYVATYYDANFNARNVNAVIKVTDASGTKTIGSDLKYVPTYSNDVQNANIDISFTDNGHVTHYTYNVPIIKPKSNSTNYMSSFFNSENATVTSSSAGLKFTSNANGNMSFNFVRPINATDMLIDLGLDLTKMDFSTFAITLKDSKNYKEKITLKYVYRLDPLLGENKLYCSLNDSEDYKVVSLGSENILRLSYDNNTYSLKDVLNAEVLDITSYSNGERFEGFSSSEIYFSFVANDVSASNFAITMQKINNQGTNITRNDYQEPDIVIGGELVSRVARGNKIIIPHAYTYDVLSSTGDLTVTLRKASGEILMQEVNPSSDLEYVLEECGSYTVTYSCTDKNGNSAERVFVISCYDEFKPELSFAKDIPSVVNVGSTLSLPKYTIIDDEVESVAVFIYLYTPEGSTKDVKNNSITFNSKGLYVLSYLVVDKNNNSNIYIFNIEAR